MEEIDRANHVGRAMELPGPLQAHHFPPHLYVFTNLKALQTISCWVFMVTSLQRHNSLNHWPLSNELSLQPLSTSSKCMHLCVCKSQISNLVVGSRATSILNLPKGFPKVT